MWTGGSFKDSGRFVLRAAVLQFSLLALGPALMRRKGLLSPGSFPHGSILRGCIALSTDGAQGDPDMLGPGSISIFLTSFHPSGCREGLITSPGSCGCASEGQDVVQYCLIFLELYTGVPTGISGSCWSISREEKMLRVLALAAKLLRGVSVTVKSGLLKAWIIEWVDLASSFRAISPHMHLVILHRKHTGEMISFLG